MELLVLLLPFYSYHTGQPALTGIPVKSRMILLEKNFTAYVPLLMEASAFRQKMLEFSSDVLLAPSPYLVSVYEENGC